MKPLDLQIIKNRPLVHMITNPVTMHDTVNIVLAAGGTAICASAPAEVSEITAKCDALLLNTGTPDASTEDAMLIAIREAEQKGIPVVLDPVGVGASEYRNHLIKVILDSNAVTVIKGNAGEIVHLAKLYGLNPEPITDSRGVETIEGVALSEDTIRVLAESLNAIVIATGEVDKVSDGKNVYSVHGGSSWSTRITGAGCMLGGYLAAALGVSENRIRISTVLDALQYYKDAAYHAELRMYQDRCVGIESFQRNLIDEMTTKPVLSSSYSLKDALHAPILYAVTYDMAEEKAGQVQQLEDIEAALRGGITLLQFRDKTHSDEEFVAFANRIRRRCHRYGVPFILNDRAHLIDATGADGVHLGQSDGSIEEVRRKYGPNFIIGRTAHNASEAVVAEAEGADYLGVGAAFATSTKSDAKPILHSEYREITSRVHIPVVAIGGIHRENIKELRGCGLQGAAVVSGIFRSPDIQKEVVELLDEAKKL